MALMTMIQHIHFIVNVNALHLKFCPSSVYH